MGRKKNIIEQNEYLNEHKRVFECNSCQFRLQQRRSVACPQIAMCPHRAKGGSDCAGALQLVEVNAVAALRILDADVEPARRHGAGRPTEWARGEFDEPKGQAQRRRPVQRLAASSFPGTSVCGGCTLPPSLSCFPVQSTLECLVLWDAFGAPANQSTSP